MLRGALFLVAASVVLAACGGEAPAKLEPAGSSARSVLQIRTLRGSVVRMGSLHGQPLYGVELHAFVCSRSSTESDQTYPTSFRVAHYVTPGKTSTEWGKPFRMMDNELHWLVPLGETRGVCGDVEFEDVIPPENYGGVESPLGVLGYSTRYRCYGVRLTLRALIADGRRAKPKPVSASKRTTVQCGRFHAG